MSEQIPNIEKVLLGKKDKLPFVRVMVYQFISNFGKVNNDWEERKGLYFPKNIFKFRESITKTLSKAEEEGINLLIFPELSVPEEIVPEIIQWSIDKETIVIGGSHYKATNDADKPFNACPIIYNGKVNFTMKRDASKFEHNLISSSNTFHVFSETPIGNFSVIICSDYLSKLKNNFNGIAQQQDIDFCIVPAFQPNAEEHHILMSGDIRNPKERYLIYCNNKNESANGNSALFGFLPNDLIDGFKKMGYTDYNPKYKAVSPTTDVWDYFIAKVDTNNKRIKSPTFIGDTTNIEDVKFGLLQRSKRPEFQTEFREIILTKETLKSTDKSIPVSTIEEQIPADFSAGDFQILSMDSYNDIALVFKTLSEKPNHYKEKKFINTKLIDDIKKSLNEKGVAFITAPIRFGKSHLLNYIREEFLDYVFISEIKGASLKVKRDEIKSIHSLYFVWYKKTVESILSKIGISKDELFNSHRLMHDRLESEKIFKQWIEVNRPIEASDIQGFIKCLAEFKTEIEFKKEILISFHFDDIQDYIPYNVFTNLRQDLIKFKNNINDSNNLTVKLLVASRYLPSNSIRNIAVNLLPHFEISSVKNFVDFFNAEMNPNIRSKLSDLILEMTDGYPWFVIRFFKIYLQKRITSDMSHPLKLANAIFQNENYWIMNSIFGYDEESEYLRELILLIEDSEPRMKNNLKRFIQLESKPTLLNDGWINENDFLIRQSGFLKIDYQGIKQNNGCFILREHFKTLIETYLP